MCKHVIAVKSLVERVRTVRQDIVEIGVPADPICDVCKGTSCRYLETRKKKREGVSIRYKYLEKKCGKKFVYAPGFKGRHYAHETITDALFQVASGLSPKSVAQGFVKNGKCIDASSIHGWTRHYGLLLRRFVEVVVVAPRAGSDWSADELHFLALGESMWLFGVMDTQSRLIVEYDSSTTKMGYDATGLFERAIRLAEKIPDSVTTDKLKGFAKGFESAVSKKGGKAGGPVHKKDAGISKVHIDRAIIIRSV